MDPGEKTSEAWRALLRGKSSGGDQMIAKRWLDHLYGSVAGQKDFQLQINFENNKKSPLKKYSQICYDPDKYENKKFLREVNQRRVLLNEIVIDLESREGIEEKLAELRSLGLVFYAFETHSKGFHIHLFFRRDLKDEEREAVINHFGGDTQLAKTNHTIALEFVPHWKSGKVKSLIDDPEARFVEVQKNDPGRLLDHVGYEEKIEPKPLPEIELPRTDKLVSKFVREIGEIMQKKNVLFYRASINQIVMVFGGSFKIVKPNTLITLLEKYFTPGIETKEGFKEKSMRSDLASTILQSTIFQEVLPKIDQILSVPKPIIYEGELTFPVKGYDPRFKSWLSPEAPEIIEMPLEEAKKIIDFIFKEFCFKSEKDKINAIACLLTPFLRGLYSSMSERTPFFFFQGNRERTGKDYCAGVRSIVYIGHAKEEAPITEEEELRKKITSAHISGTELMHFSNNKGYLNNSVLEQTITTRIWSDRMLGGNEQVSFENKMEFSASGNVGIGFTPDLTNRSRFVNLFLDIEDANSRDFENPNLHLWVLKNRSQVLSALFALVKNWVDQGMNPGNVPFASFPEWARVCGGVMESAGYISPCTPDLEMLALGGDTETKDMKSLFELCHVKKPDAWLTRNEIKDLIQEEGLFSYLDLDSRGGQTKFGLALTRFIGRILSEIRLSVQDNSVRASRQKYRFSKEVGNHGNLGNVLIAEKHFKEDKIYNKELFVANVTHVTKEDDFLCSVCGKEQAVLLDGDKKFCIGCAEGESS